MRYHPKSNKGVFSKKQKKASRHMMAMRRHGFSQPDNSIRVETMAKKGMAMAGLMSMLMGTKMRRGFA